MKTSFSQMRCRWLWALVGTAAVFGFSPPARAALGDDVAMVARDRVVMHARLQVLRRNNCEVHELALPSGTTVRQFVGDHGKIFAVAWSGGFRPDLRDIMGAHYDRFLESRRGKPRARGPLRVDLPGMVVFMGGYLRTFFGHVYLTDLVPAGLDPKDIR